MTSQPGKHTITINILLNISRSKGNQTIKFGQLIEYNMRNIFLEKSYTKCDRQTSPRPFSKKSKLSISLDQKSKFLYSLYLLYAMLRANRNTLKLSYRPLAITSCKAFLRNKSRTGTSLLASISNDF